MSVVVLATAVVLGVGSALALHLASRTRDAGSFADLPIEGGLITLRRLEGPDGAPEGELQRRGPGGEVRWRRPIENVSDPYALLAGDVVLARVTRPPFDHHWLHAYDLATGAPRWIVPDDAIGARSDFVLLDPLHLLSIEYRGHGSWIRLRELERGAIAFEVAGPVVDWDRLDVRRHDGHVYLDRRSGVSSHELDLRRGALDRGAPADASSVCRTAAEVLFIARDERLVRRTPAGDETLLGRLSAGRLRCAREADAIFVAWSDDDPSGLSSPTTPELRASRTLELQPGDTGLLAMLRDDSVVWVLASRWGWIDVGIAAPTDEAAGTPRREGSHLVGDVVEEERFVGEEVGYEGGRRAPLRIEEASGAWTTAP